MASWTYLVLVCTLLVCEAVIAQNVTAGDAACVVPCVQSTHWWARQGQHEIWRRGANGHLCGLDYNATLALGAPQVDTPADAEAALQALTSVANAAAAGCPSALPTETIAILGALVASNCTTAAIEASAVATVAAWNAGQTGPCHCTDLECARYVWPQLVIDREQVAIRKLSSASIGFLVWAIVSTVIAVLIAGALAYVLWRGNPGSPTAWSRVADADALRL